MTYASWKERYRTVRPIAIPKRYRRGLSFPGWVRNSLLKMLYFFRSHEKEARIRPNRRIARNLSQISRNAISQYAMKVKTVRKRMFSNHVSVQLPGDDGYLPQSSSHSSTVSVMNMNDSTWAKGFRGRLDENIVSAVKTPSTVINL